MPEPTTILRSWRQVDLAVFALVVGFALVLGCTTRDEVASAQPAPTVAPTAAAEPAATPGVEPTLASTAVFHPEENPDTLSGWGQLTLADGVLEPAVDVVAYELNSALFSDHAQKLRTVWIPGGEPAGYDADETFSFPVGTVITKTFWYPTAPDGAVATGDELIGVLAERLDLDTVRLVETRILVHRADGWHALPYVWNEDQTEAELSRTGDLQRLTLVEANGEPREFPYVVPNVNQCAGCHATNHTSGEIVPIGPKARHLNRSVSIDGTEIDQLDRWRTLGLLTGGPASTDAPKSAVWTDPAESLDARARAYLDINCAHCHNTNGPADTSGLFLEPSNPIDSHLGVCKPPVAAGTGTGDRRYGITPGAPEDSIFVFRMQTTDPASMMPELGRAVPHAEGIELISAWIASLDGSCG